MKKEGITAFSVETPEESSGFLLWQVTNLWQREIRKALERYDLTHSQFVLLASVLWLSMEERYITQTMLASHAKIDSMTTSTVVRTLQDKGLLKRREHPTDTRAKTLDLTSKGRKVACSAVETVERFDREFFSPLGDKSKDFNKKLILLMKKIS